MLPKTILRSLALFGLAAAAPLDKRSDFAEWAVGANWQIRDAGSFFATFDNGVKFALQVNASPSAILRSSSS